MPLTSGFGGAEGIRTPDLLDANEVRYRTAPQPRLSTRGRSNGNLSRQSLLSHGSGSVVFGFVECPRIRRLYG